MDGQHLTLRWQNRPRQNTFISVVGVQILVADGKVPEEQQGQTNAQNSQGPDIESKEIPQLPPPEESAG
jgi:hypothetical protein